jgi:hypothetical protein
VVRRTGLTAGFACAAGFALATGGGAVFGAAFFVAGLPIRAGACLAAARFAGVGRTGVFFAALFGAFFGLVAFRAPFARVLDGRPFFADRDDAPAERRAAARGELRVGRLALLPVGRFLAMAV